MKIRLKLGTTLVVGGLVLGATFLASGCGTSSTNKPTAAPLSPGSGGPDELFAETASFETVKGTPQRVTP